MYLFFFFYFSRIISFKIWLIPAYVLWDVPTEGSKWSYSGNATMTKHLPRHQEQERWWTNNNKNKRHVWNHRRINNELNLQSNLNSSNTDGSLTMADSNYFLSPYKILPTILEKKYLRKFFLFIIRLSVVYTHKNRLFEAILINTPNLPLLYRRPKRLLWIIAICFLTWNHN